MWKSTKRLRADGSLQVCDLWCSHFHYCFGWDHREHPQYHYTLEQVFCPPNKLLLNYINYVYLGRCGTCLITSWLCSALQI